MKKTIESFKGVKNSSIANYRLFFNLIDKYEELNLNVYMEGNAEHLVMNGTGKAEYKEGVDQMIDTLKNPFAEMYHWCKGEIYDVQALCDAIASRENIEKELKKFESRKKNTVEDLENVNLGKKTIRTVFKNA